MTVVQPAPNDPLPATARMVQARGWRREVLVALVVGHALGLLALVAGDWLLALALVLPTHLLVWWGTLAPGSRLLGPVVRRFETGAQEVWLTIDDGPSADTPAILDLLDAHGARATFFLVGRRAAAQPALVREILARGHSLGNHSHAHPAGGFWALPPATMAREIDLAQAELTRLAGTPPRLFRAVVGMANPFVAPRLQRHGLLLVGWSARAYDSRLADPARVWRRLRPDVRPGAILLLHEGAAHGRSVATLARVLEELDAAGYRCVLPALPGNGVDQPSRGERALPAAGP